MEPDENRPTQPRRYRGSRVVAVFLLIAVAVVAVLIVLKRTIQVTPRTLPVLLEVTNVPLTDPKGQATSLEALRHRVLVIDLQTPGCGPACEERSRQMREIQRWTRPIRAEVYQLTLSPEPIDPAEMQALAGKLEADEHWRFLAVTPEHFATLQRELLPGGDADLAVVDREGRLRRRYDTDNPEHRRELMLDLRLLAREGGSRVPTR